MNDERVASQNSVTELEQMNLQVIHNGCLFLLGLVHLYARLVHLFPKRHEHHPKC